jgi:hypothetical protein
MGQRHSKTRRSRFVSEDESICVDPGHPSFAYNHYKKAYGEIRRRVLTKRCTQEIRDASDRIVIDHEFSLLLVGFFEHGDHVGDGFSQFTDWIETISLLSWQSVNDQRLTLMADVRKVAMDVLVETNTVVMLHNGSNRRCSDMDVAISGDMAAEVCLVMVYCLGLVSKRLLCISSDTISASLNGLQRILDIELYSSSGVIRSPDQENPRRRSGLHEIQNGLFQMVRSRETTDWFYRVLVSYMWMQINGGADTIRNLRLLSNDAYAQSTLNELTKSHALSRKSRFRIQIAASAASGCIASSIFSTKDNDHRHMLLTRWEHMETLANVMSAESTVAPATFVDVVFGEQLKMRGQIRLGKRELYLVLLENLGFMERHLTQACGKHNQHLRRAYKYAMRSSSAYTRMINSSNCDVGRDYMLQWNLDPILDMSTLRERWKDSFEPTYRRIAIELDRIFLALLAFAKEHLRI